MSTQAAVLDQVQIQDVTLDVIEIEEADATQVKGTSSGAYGQRSKDQKEADTRLLFAGNSTVVAMGNFLTLTAKTPDGDKTYAQLIAAGRSLTFSKIKVNSASGPVSVTLAEPITISLTNVAQWGCVACHSAHGTDVGPSSGGDGISVKGLESNKFYYGVEQRKLFMFSKSCFDKYVEYNLLHKQIVPQLPAQKPAAPVGNGKSESKPEIKDVKGGLK